MSLGISKEEFAARQILQDGDTVISDRAFHLIFSGTLLWGFLLNILTIQLLTVPIARLLYRSSNPSVLMIGFIVLYFACCFGGCALLRSDSVLKSFLGFNLIAIPIGILLTVALMNYYPQLILHAVTITALVVGLMMLASMLFPSFFFGIGRILGISLGCCIIAELACTLLFPGWGLEIFDYAVVIIMSLYVGYDWGRMSVCVRTANNAVDFAASLYLDIINLFLRILRILARSSSKSSD